MRFKGPWPDVHPEDWSRDSERLGRRARQAATLAKDAEKAEAKAKKLREREDKKTFGYGTKHRAKLLDQLAKYTNDPGMKSASLDQLENWLRICKESAKSAKAEKKQGSNKALIQTHRWQRQQAGAPY